MTIRCLILSAAALLTYSAINQSYADNLQLTLDLRNTNRINAFGGGNWLLFARVVDTGSGVDGSTGLAGVRALLDNISLAGIVFNPAINANGAATAQAIPGDSQGTVEIVYEQDLSQPTLPGVGVPPATTPNRDVLIAGGSWPAGPRPVFGNDGTAFSSGDFLVGAGNFAIAADSVSTSVVTLGDFNNTGTITSFDIGAFVARLPRASTSLPYNPAGDINQTGTISNSDISGFVTILTGPVTAATTAIPEPTSFTLLLGTALALLGRRKKG